MKIEAELDGITDWMRENPDPHPDEKRAKRALVVALEEEQSRLRARINEQLSAWVNQRKS